MDAISLYLDHDVDVKLADRLRNHGYDVVTTREMFGSQSQRTDTDQLEYAAIHGRAILSHNRYHFKREHTLWRQKGLEHWEVITSARVTLDELERRMLKLLTAESRDQARNQYVQLHLFR